MMESHALVCTSLVVVLLLVVIARKGADRVHFRGGGPPSRGFICLGGQDQFIQNGALMFISTTLNRVPIGGADLNMI